MHSTVWLKLLLVVLETEVIKLDIDSPMLCDVVPTWIELSFVDSFDVCFSSVYEYFIEVD